ncbi:MAG: hypothetical protein ABR583_06050 [Gaiellaceae bacterium]
MLNAAKDTAPPPHRAAVLVAENFEVLGDSNLGGRAPRGDVWSYDDGGSVGEFSYVVLY